MLCQHHGDLGLIIQYDTTKEKRAHQRNNTTAAIVFSFRP